MTAADETTRRYLIGNATLCRGFRPTALNAEYPATGIGDLAAVGFQAFGAIESDEHGLCDAICGGESSESPCEDADEDRNSRVLQRDVQFRVKQSG